MNENEYISRLKARDIRPTALRLLILRTMAGFDRAFSLADLEEELDTVDKSTLFRTLTLFLAHHLVHGIDDGTGSLKYALCSSDCDCEIDDLHTHFYCTHCRRTFCLRGVAVPQVGLPDGFSNSARANDPYSRWQSVLLPVFLAAAVVFGVLSTLETKQNALLAWNLSVLSLIHI